MYVVAAGKQSWKIIKRYYNYNYINIISINEYYAQWLVYRHIYELIRVSNIFVLFMFVIVHYVYIV